MPTTSRKIVGSMFLRSATPSGTPITPPTMKGSARARLKDWRTEPIEMSWPRSEPKTTIGPARSGEMVHAQKAMATSPKAKPLRPWTKPATAAPTTT